MARPKEPVQVKSREEEREEWEEREDELLAKIERLTESRDRLFDLVNTVEGFTSQLKDVRRASDRLHQSLYSLRHELAFLKDIYEELNDDMDGGYKK